MRLAKLGLILHLGVYAPCDTLGVLAHELSLWFGLSAFNTPEPMGMLLLWHMYRVRALAVRVFALPQNECRPT